MRSRFLLGIIASIGFLAAPAALAQTAQPVGINPPAAPVRFTATKLAVDVRFDRTTIAPPMTFTATVTVTNTGKNPAANVTVTDALPDGFSYDAKRVASQFSAIGAIPAGQRKTVSFAVTLPDGTTPGRYSYAVTARAANATAVDGQANLNVLVPKVLGATTIKALPNTGPTAPDMVLFFLGVSSLVSAGLMFRRT